MYCVRIVIVLNMVCVGIVFGLLAVLYSLYNGIAFVMCSYESTLYSYCIGLVSVLVLHSHCLRITYVLHS